MLFEDGGQLMHIGGGNVSTFTLDLNATAPLRLAPADQQQLPSAFEGGELLGAASLLDGSTGERAPFVVVALDAPPSDGGARRLAVGRLDERGGWGGAEVELDVRGDGLELYLGDGPLVCARSSEALLVARLSPLELSWAVEAVALGGGEGGGGGPPPRVLLADGARMLLASAALAAGGGGRGGGGGDGRFEWRCWDEDGAPDAAAAAAALPLPGAEHAAGARCACWDEESGACYVGGAAGLLLRLDTAGAELLRAGGRARVGRARAAWAAGLGAAHETLQLHCSGASLLALTAHALCVHDAEGLGLLRRVPFAGHGALAQDGAEQGYGQGQEHGSRLMLGAARGLRFVAADWHADGGVSLLVLGERLPPTSTAPTGAGEGGEGGGESDSTEEMDGELVLVRSARYWSLSSSAHLEEEEEEGGGGAGGGGYDAGARKWAVLSAEGAVHGTAEAEAEGLRLFASGLRGRLAAARRQLAAAEERLVQKRSLLRYAAELTQQVCLALMVLLMGLLVLVLLVLVAAAAAGAASAAGGGGAAADPAAAGVLGAARARGGGGGRWARGRGGGGPAARLWATATAAAERAGRGQRGVRTAGGALVWRRVPCVLRASSRRGRGGAHGGAAAGNRKRAAVGGAGV